jgi:hypothetical protein
MSSALRRLDMNWQPDTEKRTEPSNDRRLEERISRPAYARPNRVDHDRLIDGPSVLPGPKARI